VRWVVISLLLMNALYFGWRWLQPEISAPEINQEREIELSPQSVQVNAERELPILDEEMAHAEPTPAVSESEPVADHPQQEVESSSSEATADVSSPNAQSRMVETSPIPQAVPTDSFCYWTSWQENPVDAGSNELLKQEQQEQETGRSYLVWIPPKASKEETLERLRELKTMDIESAYINRGEQKGGISLGLFSSEESVQIRLNDAKRLGIDEARTLTRVRTQTMHRAFIKQTAKNNENIPENWQKTDCPPIAPSTDAQ